MKAPALFGLGAATHTGKVRSANEDDHLLVAPPDGQPFLLLVAVADGMGGAQGGAEASLAAVRGLAADMLSRPGQDLMALMQAGFAGAAQRVAEQARLAPALLEMGTTLLGVAFVEQEAVVGHIGDCRLYLWRKDALSQCTKDHRAPGQRNQLLRCIGGGAKDQAPDLLRIPLTVGDRFLLCSDGLFAAVDDLKIEETLRLRAPQAAAARLVELALEAGAPDNVTAVVVDRQDAAPGLAFVEQALPVEEAAPTTRPRRRERLGPPTWPWAALLLAGALAALAVYRALR